jgi:hypothetical protein
MTAASTPTGRPVEARLALWVVRLVEGAVVVLLLGAAHELWSSWQNAGVDGFLGRGAVVLDRVWSVVHNQSQAPVAAIVSAVLLAGCLWLLRRSGERTFVGPAAVGSVRLEVAVLGLAGLLVALADVVAVVVAATVTYSPELGPSPLVSGEDRLTTLLPVAAGPFAAVLLYAALGCLWWLLRPGLVDGPAPVAPAPEAAPVRTDPVDARTAEAAVEERAASDGSTSNGYEEYFRRS